nr:hypothetical protein Iba_chr15aCG9420 [Ipomoea batatas]
MLFAGETNGNESVCGLVSHQNLEYLHLIRLVGEIRSPLPVCIEFLQSFYYLNLRLNILKRSRVLYSHVSMATAPRPQSSSLNNSCFSLGGSGQTRLQQKTN